MNMILKNGLQESDPKNGLQECDPKKWATGILSITMGCINVIQKNGLQEYYPLQWAA